MIRDYFSEALTQLRSHYPHIQSELEDIHAQKFISRLYVDGKLINECNIRIGGLGSSNSIGYSEGRFVLHNDNSYNEILSIEDDRSDLFFYVFFWYVFWVHRQKTAHSNRGRRITLEEIY